jgi:hypothetical protein
MSVLSEEERSVRCAELLHVIVNRLETIPDPVTEFYQVFDDLKVMGHELFSWDESDDFAIWGPNYATTVMTGLLLDLRVPTDQCEVTWLQDAQTETVRQVFGEGFH